MGVFLLGLNTADGCRREKRAISSTAKITEAIVSRKAQISSRNTSRAARRNSGTHAQEYSCSSDVRRKRLSAIYCPNRLKEAPNTAVLLGNFPLQLWGIASAILGIFIIH